MYFSKRVDRFLQSITQQCAGLKVVVVCHGNIIGGFRFRIERYSIFARIISMFTQKT